MCINECHLRSKDTPFDPRCHSSKKIDRLQVCPVFFSVIFRFTDKSMFLLESSRNVRLSDSFGLYVVLKMLAFMTTTLYKMNAMATENLFLPKSSDMYELIESFLQVINPLVDLLHQYK